MLSRMGCVGSMAESHVYKVLSQTACPTGSGVVVQGVEVKHGCLAIPPVKRPLRASMPYATVASRLFPRGLGAGRAWASGPRPPAAAMGIHALALADSGSPAAPRGLGPYVRAAAAPLSRHPCSGVCSRLRLGLCPRGRHDRPTGSGLALAGGAGQRARGRPGPLHLPLSPPADRASKPVGKPAGNPRLSPAPLSRPAQNAVACARYIPIPSGPSGSEEVPALTGANRPGPHCRPQDPASLSLCSTGGPALPAHRQRLQKSQRLPRFV